MGPITAWRFLDQERRLSPQSPESPPAGLGRVFHAEDAQAAVLRGVWGCTDLADALRHGHGLVACHIRLDGVIRQRRHTITDARELTIEWMQDATRVVNQFTCDAVMTYLLQMREVGRETDPRLWAAVESQQAWLDGTVSDAQRVQAEGLAREAWQEIHVQQWTNWSQPLVNAEWHARQGNGPPLSSNEYALLKAQVDEMNESMRWAVSHAIIAMMAAHMYIATAMAMHMFLMWHQPEQQVVKQLEERLLAIFGE